MFQVHPFAILTVIAVTMCWALAVVLFVQDYGGIEYSMEKARVYGERAKDCLGRISPSPERDALHLAADYIVDRIIPFSG